MRLNRPRPRPAPPRPGAISINAIPWADLWIDDHEAGHTPKLHLPLPPGHHKVRLKTSAGDERTRGVEIRPGKETKLTVNFSEP